MGKNRTAQEQFDDEPEIKPFKTRGSSEFISVIGLLCYGAAIVAAIALLTNLFSPNGNSMVVGTSLYVVIGGLFSGSILRILYNISEDLHYNSYCTELMANETARINSLMLRHLENLDYKMNAMTFPSPDQPADTPSPSSDQPVDTPSPSSYRPADTPSPEPSSRVRVVEHKKRMFSEGWDDPNRDSEE